MSAVVTKLKRDRITIGLLRFISEAYVNKREEKCCTKGSRVCAPHGDSLKDTFPVEERVPIGTFTDSQEFILRIRNGKPVLPDQPRDTHGAGLVGGLPRMLIKSRKCELIDLGIMHGNENLTWLYRGGNESRCRNLGAS